MQMLAVVRVFVEYQRLRLTGSRGAARRLIDALSAKDENVETLAGIFLVRAGQRSVPGLVEAIAERHPESSTSLTVLGDIGGAEAKAALLRYVGDQDPAVAEAARSSLRVISFKEGMSGEGTGSGLAVRGPGDGDGQAV